jgi:DNA-binding winged helix-turn-helix (wHTH) protein/pimeloyl-ACP methyl ester carboxylesterase
MIPPRHVDAVYRFGPFHLDVRERRLSRGGEVIPLRLKVFDTLRVLVENAGRLVTKQELLDTVWPETAVEENNLNHNVSVLRKALGEGATGQQYIETVPRVGYRFVAPVDAGVPQSTLSASSAATLRQHVHYVTATDGTRLAWAESGSGPVVVKAANWLTHLEYEWESPVWKHWIQFFSAHCRFVRFDERGCGMSDWQEGPLSMDQWFADLGSVIEAARPEGPVTLVGISQGAATCIRYALGHPERVGRMILYGGFARGWKRRGSLAAQREYQAMVDLMRVAWGKDNSTFRQVFTSRFIPGGSVEQLRWFNDLCLKTASGDIAATLQEGRAGVDVAAELDAVTTPTLVLHARGDEVIPISEGRLLASGIPGAEFVELDSRNHILLEHEPAWERFREAVLAFVQTGR